MKRLLIPFLLVLQACATPPVPEPLPEPAAEPVAVPPPPPAPVVVTPPPKPAPAAKVEKPKPPPAVTVVEPAPTPAPAAKPADDLWVRIRAGFAIPDLKNKLVTQKQRQYAARPEYLQRILDRS